MQLQDAAAHPDPAPLAMHLGDHPGPEQVPGHLRIGQHDHVVQPWRQQRPHSGGPGRPADGVEKHVDVVVAVGPGGFDHDDPVRPDQVVAKGLGPVQQRGRLRARVPDQVEHEVDPRPRFALGQVLQPGDLHGQHRGRVLDGHPFGVGCRPGRVVQNEHGHRGAAERGHREEALALPDRPRGAHGPVQQSVLLRRVGLGVRIGPVRSGPRQQVAEAVLDGRRAVGQLVHRLGDSRLPLPAERHLGQAVVNLHATHQREVGQAQLPGLFPLPAVQARVRQGHPRLLGQHLQQEPLTLRGRSRGPDDQVAGRPVAAGQRVGPPPRHVGQRDRPALGRVDDGRQAGGLPAVDPDLLPQAVEGDALRRARPQGFDRVRDVVQDAVLAVLLGHAPQRAVPAEATSIEQDDGHYRVRLGDGTSLTSALVVLATGVRYRRLDVPRAD